MTPSRLRIVPDTQEVVDIAALIRADIKERNWAAVHVQADKRPFLLLPERRKWRWS